jgi:tetratricopeptide (TPR) repeat protein
MAGAGETAADRIRAALRAAPHDAELHYALGNACMAEGDAAGADAAYAAAAAINPAHAGALNNRGNALRALGRTEEAIALYQAALDLRPEYFGTLNNVGSALLALHRPDAAEPWLRRAAAANPAYAEACNNLGGALLALDRPAEALGWFRRATALDPAQAQARFGAGLAALALGDYRAGWRDYEARWDDPRFTEDVPDYRTPIWRGATIPPGRTVLVHAEQGLGDTLQFVRYVKLLRQRGARVVLQVQAPLAPLLAPLADRLVAQSETPGADPIPPHDLRCPLLSLPHAFGTRLATIPATTPYLAAAPARVAAWRARLGPATRPRVGIAFSGSPDHPDDRLRSLPAERLVAALGTAELHVIQTGLRPDDAAALAARPDIAVHAPHLADFAETAALLMCLDLIVTVDTSLAHLAGALGRPVAILLQHAADFRWLRGRSDSPWYPSARLYRQPVRGDWTTPLARLGREWREAVT